MKQRKWSRLELVRQSDLRLSTINNMLGGGGVFLSTVITVAKALEVDNYGTLLPADDPDFVAEPSSTPLSAASRIQITLNFNLDGKLLADPEVCKLIERLKMIASTVEDLEPVKVNAGSLLVTVDIHLDDFIKILVAFADGYVDSEKLDSITVPNEHCPVALRALKESDLADVPARLDYRMMPMSLFSILIGPQGNAAIESTRSRYQASKTLKLQLTDLRDGSIELTKVADKSEKQRNPVKSDDPPRSGESFFSKVWGMISSLLPGSSPVESK